MARKRYAPYITDKHETTWSDLQQDSSAIQIETIATAVLPNAQNLNTEVAIGSQIPWVYIEFNVAAEVVTSPKTIHWKFEKVRTGQTATSPALMYQDDRRQVLKRGMEMLPKDVSTVYKRAFTIKLPRGMRTMQAGDILQFLWIASSTETVNCCGITIYKETK